MPEDEQQVLLPGAAAASAGPEPEPEAEVDFSSPPSPGTLIISVAFEVHSFQVDTSTGSEVLRLKFQYWLEWDDPRVAELPVPVLFIAGEQDEVVPHSQMLQLHAAHAAGAGSSVARCSRLAVFPGGSHNTTWMLPNYYGEIETFLKGLA